jgi:hypothetical protein
MTDEVNTIRAPRTKDRPYFSMARTTAQDDTLTWEARGVLAYLLSKPDNWQVVVSNLQQKCGRDKVRKILKELTDAHYLEVEQVHDNKGKFARNQYRVFETPFTENPSTVSPSTANPPLTDNREEQITELDSPAHAGDEPIQPAKPKIERPANPMYDAIKDVWGYTAARNGQMAAVLNGTSTKKGYSEYNLEQPITPDELRLWAAWYRRTALGGDAKLNMVEELIKIQSSITRWQELTADGGTGDEDPYEKMFETETVIGGKPWEAQS